MLLNSVRAPRNRFGESKIGNPNIRIPRGHDVHGDKAMRPDAFSIIMRVVEVQPLHVSHGFVFFTGRIIKEQKHRTFRGASAFLLDLLHEFGHTTFLESVHAPRRFIEESS